MYISCYLLNGFSCHTAVGLVLELAKSTYKNDTGVDTPVTRVPISLYKLFKKRSGTVNEDQNKSFGLSPAPKSISVSLDRTGIFHLNLNENLPVSGALFFFF